MTAQKETTLNILLVDDDSSLIEVAKSILNDMDKNLNIESASTVNDAFHKLSSNTYDAIISDYEIPNKNGLDFLKELREKNNTTPFILFTGRGREEIAIQALNLGADHYINKHGNPETVYKEVTISIHQLYEKTRAKNLFLESEERLRLFIENAPDAIFVCSPDGTLLDQNKPAEQLHGYKKEQLIGKNLFETGIIPRETAVLAKKRMQAIKAGHKVGPTEVMFIRKDGTAVFVEVSIFPVKRGNNIELLGIARDITERKTAERELAQKYEALERVAQSIDSGLAIIGKDYRVVWANSILQQLCTESTKHCYEIFNNLNTICPDCGVKKVFENNAAIDIHEYKTKDLNGNPLWVELRVTPLKDKKGNTIAALELAVPITERKKAEKQIVLTSSIFDLATDAIFVTDMNGVIISFNEAAYKRLGYTKEEFAQLKIHQIDSSESASNIKQRIKEIDKKGEMVFEAEHLCKDKTKISVEVHAKIIQAEGKKLILSVIRDISERKKAQETLLESEERYRIITENMSDVITIATTDGYFTYVSPSAKNVYGYAPEELVGKYAFCFMHPDDVAGILPFTLSSLEKTGESPFLEFRFKRKDGAYVWIESNAKVFIDSKGQRRVLAASRVIENRKKVEKKLKLTSSMFDLVNDSIYAHDREGNLVYFNKAAYRNRGYTKEELTKVNLCQLDANTPEKVGQKMKEVIEKGSIVFESVHLNKDGTKVPVEVHANLVEVEGKRFALSVVRDIVERKKAEAHLEAVNEKLRVVGKLTRHDVRNKLSTINSTTYLLKMKYANDPELIKYLSSIDSSVAMANRLFDFTALYEKIGAQEQTEINIKTCFDEAVALCSNLGNIDIVNDTVGLVVVADSLLRQVFYNLIDNSLKHGQKVTQIKLYYLNDCNQTRLIYEDNGVGVSMENKPRIFSERFTTGNGTGLGLSTIKKMMDVYNWTIQETGISGAGVKFEITIPSKGRVS